MVCYNLYMDISTGKVRERALYEPVKKYLAQMLRKRFDSYHLEITARGTFSETLKRVVQQDIIFSFLKTEAPDLTGFTLRKNIDVRVATSRHIKNFITVEVKRDPVILKDIYQAKRYGDLFHAEYALLVSLEPIREEIKRLHDRLSILNRFQGLKVRSRKVKGRKAAGWKAESWKVYIGQVFVKDSGNSRLEIEGVIWFPLTPF